MLTIDSLMDFLGAPEGDRDFVSECLLQAATLVSAYTTSAIVPQNIYDLSSQQVASELYNRRNAPSGIAQFSSLDGQTPFRVAKDPMTSVYAILGRFVNVGV